MTIDQPTTPEGLGSPLRVLRILWERKKLVLATVIVCFGAAAAMTLTAERQYSSTAELLFRDPGFARTLFGSDLFESNANPERNTSTNIAVIESAQVTERVAQHLAPIRPDELRSSIEVAAGDNADIVAVTATTSDPERSAVIANAYVTEYIAYSRELDREQVRDAKQVVENTLETAPQSQQVGLLDSLQQLTVLEALQTGNATVVARAAPDPNATSPKPIQTSILAILVGFLLGGAIALLLDFVDRRLKNVGDFERIFGKPVLVSVPRSAVPSIGDGDAGVKTEPYRMLREGLQFLELGGRHRCILVTSPDAAEGKTTVAVNLARTMATGGERVVLVEADLRRPSAATQLGVHHGGIGLSRALLTTDPLDEFLIEAMPGASLRLLPTGPAPPNPADLLRSPRMRQLITDAKADADVVIIDAPPLLPVSDTLVLLDLPVVDGVLVIGRINSTRRDRAHAARRLIEQSEKRVLGVVVTGTRERLSDYGYYHSRSTGIQPPKGNGHSGASDERVATRRARRTHER